MIKSTEDTVFVERLSGSNGPSYGFYDRRTATNPDDDPEWYALVLDESCGSRATASEVSPEPFRSPLYRVVHPKHGEVLLRFTYGGGGVSAKRYSDVS